MFKHQVVDQVDPFLQALHFIRIKFGFTFQLTNFDGHIFKFDVQAFGAIGEVFRLWKVRLDPVEQLFQIAGHGQHIRLA